MDIQEAIYNCEADGVICETKGSGSVEAYFVKIEELSDNDKKLELREIKDTDIAECYIGFEEDLKSLELSKSFFSSVTNWEYFDKESEYINNNEPMYRFWF